MFEMEEEDTASAIAAAAATSTNSNTNPPPPPAPPVAAGRGGGGHGRGGGGAGGRGRGRGRGGGGGRGGRPPGARNYRNDILIDIVDKMRPIGLEAWKAVAAAYMVDAAEESPRDAKDLRDHWVKKLCNNYKILHAEESSNLNICLPALNMAGESRISNLEQKYLR